MLIFYIINTYLIESQYLFYVFIQNLFYSEPDKEIVIDKFRLFFKQLSDHLICSIDDIDDVYWSHTLDRFQVRVELNEFKNDAAILWYPKDFDIHKVLDLPLKHCQICFDSESFVGRQYSIIPLTLGEAFLNEL